MGLLFLVNLWKKFAEIAKVVKLAGILLTTEPHKAPCVFKLIDHKFSVEDFAC